MKCLQACLWPLLCAPKQKNHSSRFFGGFFCNQIGLIQIQYGVLQIIHFFRPIIRLSLIEEPILPNLEFYPNKTKVQPNFSQKQSQKIARKEEFFSSVYLVNISTQYFLKRFDLLSNKRLSNSDDEILAKSQTLSSKLKTSASQDPFPLFHLIGLPSWLYDLNKLLHDKKIEYVDLC